MAMVMMVIVTVITISCNKQEEVVGQAELTINISELASDFIDFVPGTPSSRTANEPNTFLVLIIRDVINNEIVFSNKYGNIPESIVVPNLYSGEYDIVATAGVDAPASVDWMHTVPTLSSNSSSPMYYGNTVHQVVVGQNNINIEMRNISSDVYTELVNTENFETGESVIVTHIFQYDYNVFDLRAMEFIDPVGQTRTHEMWYNFQANIVESAHRYVVQPHVIGIKLELIDKDGQTINEVSVELNPGIGLGTGGRLNIYVDVDKLKRYAGGQNMSLTWSPVTFSTQQEIYLP